MIIQEFCDKHNACREGREWALANCNSMQEAWDKCERSDWLIWIATRPNVLDDKTLRLFAVWCCRQIQHLMTDPRSIAAVDAAEQFANGLISKEQLKAAAYASAASAANAAAYAAYAAAAYGADAAYGAAKAAAYAAYAAAYGAADAAYAAYAANASAVFKTAKLAQVNYLRQNSKPNFQ